MKSNWSTIWLTWTS